MTTIKFVPNESFPLNSPTNAPINASRGMNLDNPTFADFYDEMDAAAKRRGFSRVYSTGVLYIGTGDYKRKKWRMVSGEEFLNNRLEELGWRGVPFLVGLVQVGKYNIHYRIYVQIPFGQTFVNPRFP